MKLGVIFFKISQLINSLEFQFPDMISFEKALWYKCIRMQWRVMVITELLTIYDNHTDSIMTSMSNSRNNPLWWHNNPRLSSECDAKIPYKNIPYIYFFKFLYTTCIGMWLYGFTCTWLILREQTDANICKLCFFGKSFFKTKLSLKLLWCVLLQHI